MAKNKNHRPSIFLLQKIRIRPQPKKVILIEINECITESLSFLIQAIDIYNFTVTSIYGTVKRGNMASAG